MMLRIVQPPKPTVIMQTEAGVVIDLETAPGRHGWLYPTDGILVHANHFQAFVPEQIADTYRPFSPDSLYRTVRIEDILRTAKSATTSAAVRDVIAYAMRDHFGCPNSVCNHPDARRDPLEQTQTVASSSVDLTSGEYRVIAGMPCESKYTKLPWNLYDGVGETPPAPTAARSRHAALAH
jgi:isopenicillin-N N-acyltransferase-like protein